jgi:two-component system nitrate/nitrite sensor histidine kinase NarX
MPVAAEVQYRYSHPTAAAPILPLSLPLPMSALPLPTTAKPDSAILAEIAAGVSAGRDLPELLGRFLAPVMRLAGAQGGAVRLLDETSERLHLISQIALPPELCQGQASASRHCGHCGNAANQALPVWAHELSHCQGGRRAPPEAGTAGAGHGMFTVPLQHRGQVLGVYNLFFQPPVAPSAEVQALLRTVGELLGLALHNARLEAEVLRTTLQHERQAMAADVHDSVAQQLAFVRMRLPLLQDAVQAQDRLAAQGYLADLRGAIGQAHTSLRGILTHFRAPMDPQGLVHALAATAQAFMRHSGAELEVTNALPDLQLAPEQETQVFHIVQEALNNVARHAAAQRAWLHIAQTQAEMVEVRVEDDGSGLPAHVGQHGSATHHGLAIMQERAQRIGGRLDLAPRPGGGTVVRLLFAPLPPVPSAASLVTAMVEAH